MLVPSVIEELVKMSTPNKRRKKNDHQASSQPTRGLDFFFGKKGAEDGEKKRASTTNATVTNGANNDLQSIADAAPDHAELTDEQLARKLQAEWDEQDRAQQTNGEVVTVHDEHDKEQADTVAGLDQKAAEEAAIFVKEEVEKADTKPVDAFGALGKKNTLSLQSATAEEDTTSSTIPFDQSPLLFDPQKYIPDLQKQWAKEGGACTYALLTHCFILVNSTQSRIKIVDTLVNLLRTIVEGDPDSLLPLSLIHI